MKLFKPTLVAIALLSVLGCGEAKQEKAVLETDEQKQAYALGASVGSYMNRNLEQQETLGAPLDKSLVIKGITEGIEGNSQLSPEEIKAILSALNDKMTAKMQEAAEKETAEMEKEMAEIVDAGPAYLEENAKKEGVVVTESGLQYEVIVEGEGEKPSATDAVTVHYTGTFINGKTFDSSVERGKPITFALNRVIAGWTEGVQLMPVGSKYKFTIPSDLAYGPQGNPQGGMPGNAVLVFDVELLEIKKAEQPAEVVEAPAQ